MGGGRGSVFRKPEQVVCTHKKRFRDPYDVFGRRNARSLFPKRYRILGDGDLFSELGLRKMIVCADLPDPDVGADTMSPMEIRNGRKKVWKISYAISFP